MKKLLLFIIVLSFVVFGDAYDVINSMKQFKLGMEKYKNYRVKVIGQYGYVGTVQSIFSSNIDCYFVDDVGKLYRVVRTPGSYIKEEGGEEYLTVTYTIYVNLEIKIVMDIRLNVYEGYVEVSQIATIGYDHDTCSINVQNSEDLKIISTGVALLLNIQDILSKNKQVYTTEY